MSKSIKILLLAVAFTFSGVLSASTEPEPTTTNFADTISVEIGELLKNPGFLITDEITAEVKVMINEKNQLVVLSVNSKHDILDSFVKSRLNYKKLSVKLKTGQKKYMIPVRIVQK